MFWLTGAHLWLHRVAKALRTVEDVMQYEQELASDKVGSNGNAEAAAEVAAVSMSVADPTEIAELEQQVEQGSGANKADDLELCSTTDLLNMFDEYYQEDKERADTDFLVSHERINLDIDFAHPALSNPGRGSAAAPVRAEVGSGKAECDVESLIATE